MGTQSILIDGRLIDEKRCGWLTGRSHFFDIEDEQGNSRHVEVRFADLTKLKIGRWHVIISIDGVERCILKPITRMQASGRCPNCGYDLQGQTPDNGEVQCPECGRHSLAPERQ